MTKAVAYCVGEGEKMSTAEEKVIHDSLSTGQLVFSGHFENFVDPWNRKINGFIFDTPGVDDSLSLWAFYEWSMKIFQKIDTLAAKDAVLILLPTNRRGGSYFKSSIIETAATISGWKACRELIWDQMGDYNRAKYPFRKITIFRRGQMGMMKSNLRYVDIIRQRPPAGGKDGEYAPVPSEILYDLLDLFPFTLVCDPFAGTGSLAQASRRQHIACISCELDPMAARKIAADVTPKEEQLNV
jgi:hypothetical protein